MIELFIDGHSHGVFPMWCDALREAEYLIGESDFLDPMEIHEVALRRIEP